MERQPISSFELHRPILKTSVAALLPWLALAFSKNGFSLVPTSLSLLGWFALGAASDDASYRLQWSSVDNLSGREEPVGDAIELDEPSALVPDSAWGPEDDVGDRYALASIRTLHPDFPHWREAVVVGLRDRAGQLDVVGIERPTIAVEP